MKIFVRIKLFVTFRLIPTSSEVDSMFSYLPQQMLQEISCERKFNKFSKVCTVQLTNMMKARSQGVNSYDSFIIRLLNSFILCYKIIEVEHFRSSENNVCSN